MNVDIHGIKNNMNSFHQNGLVFFGFVLRFQSSINTGFKILEPIHFSDL